MAQFEYAIYGLIMDDIAHCVRVNKHARKKRKISLFWALFREVEKKFEIGWKVGLKFLPLCAIRYRPKSLFETLKQTK